MAFFLELFTCKVGRKECTSVPLAVFALQGEEFGCPALSSYLCAFSGYDFRWCAYEVS